jgi:hypothetical protein
MVTATGRLDEAEASVVRMERDAAAVGRPLASVLAGRARASVLLARGEATAAVEQATRSVAEAYDAGIVLERRPNQILLGRAQAATGERQRAIHAELALDAGGAPTMRDEGPARAAQARPPGRPGAPPRRPRDRDRGPGGAQRARA